MDHIAETNYRKSADLMIQVNEQYWPIDLEVEDDWIYVLHDVHTRFSICTLEDIVAKGLQGKERLSVAGIISGRADFLMELVDQIDRSFGIEQRFHPSYHDYNSEEIENLAKKMADETYGEKEKLIELTYRNVRFGDVLYDDILRGGDVRNRGKTFSCFEISQEQYYCYIRNALAIIDQAYEIFSSRPPRYLVTSQYFYTKGLYAHVAKVLGAKIIIPSIDCPDIVIQVNPDNRALSEIKVADTLRAKMEKCLAGYQANECTPENFFVMDPMYPEQFKITNKTSKKKNIFILPHAFGDAPRESCRLNFYYDYHEWFLDTLRIIQNISNVNWIIKDHPWAAYYKQEDYVKSIFEKYKTENMFWIDNKCSGMNIKEVADCVITAAGDAGIEYWAYGIPTITVGDAHYCSWGISYQMKTLAEYEKMLKNLNNIGRPSEDSVKLAKKYLTAHKNWGKHGDPYSELLRNLWLKEENILGAGGSAFGIKDTVDQQLGKGTLAFSEAYADLLREIDIKSSRIYQLENICEI